MNTSKFESLELLSKCCMASYCRHSAEDKYCVADDEIVKECPYLKAINEVSILSAELAETDENCRR